MKRAIVCYVNGETYEEQFKLTSGRIKAYAHFCDAELVVLTSRTGASFGETDKFQAKDIFEQFDMSLFLDVDVVIQNNPPSIFDLVPMDKVSGFNELPSIYSFRKFEDLCPYKYVAESQHMLQKQPYFIMNSGVFTIPRNLHYLYRYPDFPIAETTRMIEQTLFNCRLQESNKFNQIGEEWNLRFRSSNMERMRYSAYFVHFNIKPFSKRLDEMRKQLRYE